MRFLAPPLAHRIACARLFAFDDVGAEIGHQLSAKWSGQKLTHFNDAHIGQWTLTFLFLRHATPVWSCFVFVVALVAQFFAASHMEPQHLKGGQRCFCPVSQV